VTGNVSRGYPPERLYIDAEPIIYFVEGVSGLAEQVDARLSAPGVEVLSSDLTRMECRVKPLRDGNTDLLIDFDRFFSDSVAEIVSLTREVVDRATELRATYRVRTPDALHLAAAIVGGCSTFLTNDHRLSQVQGIRIEVLSEQD
jgi:uncharacterized protein